MSGSTRRRKLAAATAIALLALAATAFAYFSSTGSGSGSATVGSSSGVTLHGTVSTALYPGTSSTVTFTVDNPSPGSERVGTIHLVSVTPDGTHSTCVGTDFTMTNVVANQVFPTGSGQSVTATGTLAMGDSGVSQDACQGATLTLALTST
jgi:hypothetical protein